MKKLLISTFIVLSVLSAKAQVTTLAGDYKIIDIGDNGFGDYTRSLILLHEIYNGTLIDHNYTIGTITAMRGAVGAGNRINVVNVNTSSGYNGTSGTINSYDGDGVWSLKTCIYNSKKYLAVDVPYSPAFHTWGFKFSGATTSTGESMKCVSYEVNGVPVNQTLISNIQDFNSNMAETHVAATFNITGNVGIGVTDTHGDKLAVNGNIHSKQVTVDLNNWADYVFDKDYSLKSLSEVKTYIDQNHHLPEMPSEQEVAEKGLNLGEMNKLLTQKVEELTLYLIEKDKQVQIEKKFNKKQQAEIDALKDQMALILKRLKN